MGYSTQWGRRVGVSVRGGGCPALYVWKNIICCLTCLLDKPIISTWCVLLIFTYMKLEYYHIILNSEAY